MSGEKRTVINDRYEIEGRVGRGGMADVFLARDLLLDRPVAIKVLFPEYATDPAFVERFRREAQAAANLNHPNIVSVYDWGSTDNTYFIAMEYVQGRTLADILKRQGRLTPTQAADVAIQVAAALGSAHRNGVVHRDVKPGNILIGSNGDIKVADFGIARAIDASHDSNLTQEGAVMGTATYFSPEQAKGEMPDPRSDIYSLGIVLYELVTGTPPFVAENALATAYKQVHDFPTPLNQLLPTITTEFEAIVAKCLSKFPERRYETAEALRDDLRRFREGAPVGALIEHLTTNEAVTTTMGALSTDPGVTTALPRTQVMPASATPRQSADDGEYEIVRNTNPKVIIGALTAAVVVIVGIIALVSSLSGSGSNSLSAPDLLSRTYKEAAQAVLDAGLIAVPNPVAKEGLGDDIVYKQSPPAGTSMKRGDEITLTYNPAKAPVPPVIVPAIQGLTVPAATALLKPLGLTLTISEVRNDPTLAVGQIITQDPLATGELAPGSAVKVVVSGGVGQVVIPDIAGFTAAAAQKLLQEKPNNFVVTVLTEASATITKGLAVRTDPAIGLPIDAGKPITLYTSSGPEQVAVPAVEGLEEAVARNSLALVSLVADVRYVDVPSGSVNIGKVISQGTDAQSKADPQSKIVITVGRLAATPVTTTLAPAVTTTVAPAG